LEFPIPGFPWSGQPVPIRLPEEISTSVRKKSLNLDNIFLDAAALFGLIKLCFVQMLDVELNREPR
jgi:hypothetical protein